MILIGLIILGFIVMNIICKCVEKNERIAAEQERKRARYR
jgi:hypothetical protein